MNETLVALALRCQRIACGWTLDQAGQMSGIHEDTLSKIETGKQKLTVAHLFVLADAYNVKPDALIRGEVSVIGNG